MMDCCFRSRTFDRTLTGYGGHLPGVPWPRRKDRPCQASSACPARGCLPTMVAEDTGVYYAGGAGHVGHCFANASPVVRCQVNSEFGHDTACGPPYSTRWTCTAHQLHLVARTRTSGSRPQVVGPKSSSCGYLRLAFSRTERELARLPGKGHFRPSPAARSPRPRPEPFRIGITVVSKRGARKTSPQPASSVIGWDAGHASGSVTLYRDRSTCQGRRHHDAAA